MPCTLAPHNNNNSHSPSNIPSHCLNQHLNQSKSKHHPSHHSIRMAGPNINSTGGGWPSPSKRRQRASYSRRLVRPAGRGHSRRMVPPPPAHRLMEVLVEDVVRLVGPRGATYRDG